MAPVIANAALYWKVSIYMLNCYYWIDHKLHRCSRDDV